MTLAGSTAHRWAVTTRTHGEILTAGISAGELELVLLGIPTGFTPAEIEGWLRDLAGVARETSATDSRVRAIPPMLHHALTGLLFSHAELWHRPGDAGPCSVAFVDTPLGPAFGWVGEARVQVLRGGESFEPMWVRVRDEEGREARAFAFEGDTHLMIALDHWPQGESDLAPPAAVEAEWSPTGVEDSSGAAEPSTPAPTSIARPEPPAEAAASRASEPVVVAVVQPLPESLPQQQPGLLGAPVAAVSDARASVLAQSAAAFATALPVEHEDVHAVAETSDGIETVAAAAPPPIFAADPTSESMTEAVEDEAPRVPHPVGRWLNRLMSWGRKPKQELDEQDAAPEVLFVHEGAQATSESALATPESAPLYGDQPAPLSAYDSLLSASVPAESTAIAQAQTAIEWEGAHAVPTPADPSAIEGLPEDEAALMAESCAIAQAPPAPALEVDEGVTGAPELVLDEGIAGAPLRTVSERFAAAPAAPPVAVPSPAIAATTLAPMPPLALPTPEPAPVPVPVIDSRLAAANFGSVFGSSVGSIGSTAAAAPAASAPEPTAPALAPSASLADVDLATLPVLSPPLLSADPTAPVTVDHEPVGAHETFAIPQVPARPQPPPAPSTPPMLRVELPRETPVAPIAVTPSNVAAPVSAAAAGQARDAHASPPVLKLPEAARTGPPVLRVAMPPTAPPVLSVASAPRPAKAQTEQAIELTPASPMLRAEALQRVVTAARPVWPSVEELAAPSAWYRKPWVWGSIMVALFAVGWLLGTLNDANKDEPGPFAKFARVLGLGAPRFIATIDSEPQGAWIAVDGKDLARRTPSKVELAPGEHLVTLTLPDLGSAKFSVRGQKNEKVALDQTLNGDLEIYAADSGVPIAVAVDGKPQGYAPVKMESIAPGLHEVQFSGPGMPAWAQTIQVGVRRTAQLVAHPMAAPANGVIQAQAMLNDDQGASALSGAQVFVDGEMRGNTPISVELPRGPHSLRVSWHGETAPVQVIDLPGGNQRFATFNFGLAAESPRVTLLSPLRVMPSNSTTLISAQLENLQPGDVRESWLHARAPEGLWRRYPMNVMRAANGTVIVCVFPLAAFDAQSQTRWYVSATTQQGDEVFSEIQSAQLATAHAAAPAGHAARRKPAEAVAPTH